VNRIGGGALKRRVAALATMAEHGGGVGGGARRWGTNSGWRRSGAVETSPWPWMGLEKRLLVKEDSGRGKLEVGRGGGEEGG
jgi:hypothetical protein